MTKQGTCLFAYFASLWTFMACHRGPLIFSLIPCRKKTVAPLSTFVDERVLWIDIVSTIVTMFRYISPIYLPPKAFSEGTFILFH